MEKNDFSGMQSENVLGNLSAEEIGKLEAYYVREAEHLMLAEGQEKMEPLEFMVNQRRKMEHFFRELQFPWEESIPILYGCFMHYIVLVEGKERRRNLSDLMTKLIKTMNFLAKKQLVISGLEHDYHQQREEIEALIALKNNPV